MSGNPYASETGRIRQSAVSIISREGINGCSAAAVAGQAGVSVGYLYRHYPGKETLAGEDICMSLVGISVQYLGIRCGGRSAAGRCGDEATVRMAANALRK